jgi:hypothetical protein
MYQQGSSWFTATLGNNYGNELLLLLRLKDMFRKGLQGISTGTKKERRRRRMILM